VIDNLLLVRSGVTPSANESPSQNDIFASNDSFSRRNKRKARIPQQLANNDDTQMDISQKEEHSHLEPEQPSPAVSDSQTSGSSAHLEMSASPKKCMNCEVMKSKVEYAESRIREFEEKSHGRVSASTSPSPITAMDTMEDGENDVKQQLKDLHHRLSSISGKAEETIAELEGDASTDLFGSTLREIISLASI